MIVRTNVCSHKCFQWWMYALLSGSSWELHLQTLQTKLLMHNYLPVTKKINGNLWFKLQQVVTIYNFISHQHSKTHYKSFFHFQACACHSILEDAVWPQPFFHLWVNVTKHLKFHNVSVSTISNLQLGQLLELWRNSCCEPGLNTNAEFRGQHLSITTKQCFIY